MGSLISWPFGQRVSPRREPRRQPALIILEDDSRLRAALVALFARHGLLALLVSDGTALIRQLTRCLEEARPGLVRVDTVVVDIDAPGRSGIDILSVVRARRWPLRVVLTSPLASPALRAEVLRMGAAGLLDRPVTPRQWDKVLRTVAYG
jgi:DNA-binding response OmpR family regulator